MIVLRIITLSFSSLLKMTPRPPMFSFAILLAMVLFVIVNEFELSTPPYEPVVEFPETVLLLTTRGPSLRIPPASLVDTLLMIAV